jgi:hypothetical protein
MGYVVSKATKPPPTNPPSAQPEIDSTLSEDELSESSKVSVRPVRRDRQSPQIFRPKPSQPTGPVKSSIDVHYGDLATMQVSPKFE